jgi:hypothetical protein
MKNRINITGLGLICLFFVATSCFNNSTNGGDRRSGKCKLPDQNWMTVTAGYDSKTALALATKFEAAAKVDLEKIKAIGSGEGAVKGSFDSDFSKVVNATSKQHYEVSQDFFENYRSKRDPICGILVLLDRDNISNSTKESAEKMYLSLTQSWSEIKEREEKKVQ